MGGQLGCDINMTQPHTTTHFNTQKHTTHYTSIIHKQPHLKGEVASCSSSGPTARALGARKGDRNGMESVAGLLLKLINTLPSRCWIVEMCGRV